ncbi:alpha/beta fold hydrolase [Orrella sp. NBD-18]|uniref:Alpha/beta fold hydrolase n=1 Tax=Sheuella amnicola TaxID=2707330 RepID=A0A6B2QWP1_9BURK|nr:alpha/beta fold hydrolase [Sheuella amnicola]NDY81684.1 alpha/beta fold hydrolase [Sheuella amnicola]
MTNPSDTRPVLVMLSGHMCSEALWQNQVDHFSDRYRCMPMVFRQGDSIADFAQQVLQHAPEEFYLMGLSMGGYVAFEVMRRAPERVIRLALLDTSAESENPERTIQRKIDLQTANEKGLAALADQLPARWMHPDMVAKPTLFEKVREMVLNVGLKAFGQQQRAIIERANSFSSLKNIQCPTLVLCGRQDTSTPVSMHEDIVKQVPQAKLVIIEHCGHLSTMEQPAEVNRALDAWLK